MDPRQEWTPGRGSGKVLSLHLMPKASDFDKLEMVRRIENATDVVYHHPIHSTCATIATWHRHTSMAVVGARRLRASIAPSASPQPKVPTVTSFGLKKEQSHSRSSKIKLEFRNRSNGGRRTTLREELAGTLNGFRRIGRSSNTGRHEHRSGQNRQKGGLKCRNRRGQDPTRSNGCLVDQSSMSNSVQVTMPWNCCYFRGTFASIATCFGSHLD